MSASDLTEEFEEKSLTHWQMRHGNLIRHRSELMAKFLWLEISQERFEEAATTVHNPDFSKISIVLKDGKYEFNFYKWKFWSNK